MDPLSSSHNAVLCSEVKQSLELPAWSNIIEAQIPIYPFSLPTGKNTNEFLERKPESWDAEKKDKGDERRGWSERSLQRTRNIFEW